MTAIKERPIMFSGEMVRAILEGRKTQTRRVIDKVRTWPGVRGCDGGCVWATPDGRPYPERGWIKCPYGQPGDRLWVRETWSYFEHPVIYDCIRYKTPRGFWKPAFRLRGMSDNQCWQFEQMCDGPEPDHRWRSPIHMPRWASRITLEITDVRVERLQDISEEDAKAEGVSETCVLPGDRGSFIPSFGMLWEQINGKRGYGWEANPHVWVVEFRRTKQ